MRIILKSLHIENFKGIKSLEVNFQIKQVLRGRMQPERPQSSMHSHGFCLIRTVPERKSSIFDRWIKTEIALIT